jgi:hypothetical protein
MNHLGIIDRWYHLDQLIKQEATGTPKEFAQRVHLGERQLYYILSALRDFGAEIHYSRIRCTYFYVNDFDLKSVRGLWIFV